ncbi:hypothetical protein Bbelb_172220 [Branchiostoma belcheri]|nr:hypothetical protein Bbelb_172220 [Branchiostoma belcheri]
MPIHRAQIQTQRPDSNSSGCEAAVPGEVCPGHREASASRGTLLAKTSAFFITTEGQGVTVLCIMAEIWEMYLTFYEESRHGVVLVKVSTKLLLGTSHETNKQMAQHWPEDTALAAERKRFETVTRRP